MSKKTDIKNTRMKKIKKIATTIGTGVISLSAIVPGINIIYSDTKANENLLNTTITQLIYDTSAEIYKGPTKNSGKVAYITIDDGPSKHTGEILKILNKYNAKATFFMINANMISHKEDVKNIVRQGHTPAFHSVSHDIHKLYKTASSAKEEFDINNKTFYDIVGEKSDVIRLPYGSKPYTPTSSYEELVKAGYKIWDWDIDTQDWRATSNQIVENVKTYSKNEDEIVILMHEKKQTVEALDGMLNYLQSEGYEFLPINKNQQPQNYWLGNLHE